MFGIRSESLCWGDTSKISDSKQKMYMLSFNYTSFSLQFYIFTINNNFDDVNLFSLQLHNAHQLADWCMNHLCVNYNKLCRMSPRSLRLLHPDNQAYLVEHRWPPVWYLKDYDYYQKCLVERDRETKHALKSSSGCLCFSRKSESDPALSGHL